MIPLEIVDQVSQGITVEGLLRGLTILVGGVVAAFALSFLARGLMKLRGRGPSSRKVLSRLLFWVTVLAGVLVASAAAFPSINPVDVLGGLGVISIAAGIAFQTVLSNFFAGIVILARDQYRVGDQIKIGDTAGTVMGIHLSSTSIRTFDGRLVIVPNNIMHSNKVVVQTGYEKIRTSVMLDIDADNDLREAKQVAEQAMTELPVVLQDPAPRAMFNDIGAQSVTMELLFWSGSTRLESREATDAVILTVLAAFEDAGITVSAPTLDGILAEGAARLEAEGISLSEDEEDLDPGIPSLFKPKKKPASKTAQPKPRTSTVRAKSDTRVSKTTTPRTTRSRTTPPR